MKLDFLIEGAMVFDGEQEEPKRMDVGVRGDQIAFLGTGLGASAASTRVPAKGLWLSPGFIDSHASTGLGYFFDSAADHKLFQGVTTELIGNCGTSPGPIGPHLTETMEELASQIGFSFQWHSLAEYFSLLEKRGVPINLATLVGHSTLRAGAVQDWEAIEPSELNQMCRALDQALSEGAFGLSSGLIYPPGCFADTEEIVTLSRVANQWGGVYASHIRDERDHLEEAVDEALEIGRRAGIPVLVSHLKAAEQPNWGKIPGVIQQIEDFRREYGTSVIFDVYPYTAVSTKIRAFLPKELMVHGVEAVPQKLEEPEWIRRCIEWLRFRSVDLSRMQVISQDIRDTAGRSITHLGESWGILPEEAACRLVHANPEAWMVYHCLSQEDVDASVLYPDSIICSDSWSYPVNSPHQVGEPHPRTYGAFSRFLRRYVFERPLLSYGAAVRKMTSMSADFLGLEARGRIREGARADLLLLDPLRFEDRATFERPRRLASGVAFLWLNGKLAIREGDLINERCGEILRRTA